MLSTVGSLLNQFHPVSIEGTEIDGHLGSNCWQQVGLMCVAGFLTGGLVGGQEAFMGFMDLVIEGASITMGAAPSMDLMA